MMAELLDEQAAEPVGASANRRLNKDGMPSRV
jgi:hypothetical protein